MINSRFDRDPLESLLRLQDDLARSMGPRSSQPREHVSSQVWSPRVDVYEDNDVIVLKAELPGMSQEEIDIEITGENLTIKGMRKFEDVDRRDKFIRIERQYGAFERSFTIGVPIDEAGVKAGYRNGILEITLPKAEITKPKKVQVSIE